MATANIRIGAEGNRQPIGGFAGALTGATEPGAAQTIEVDLTELAGGDVAAILPVLAETYRTAFFGERVERGEIGEIPFPEAGDPHPFPDVENATAAVDWQAHVDGVKRDGGSVTIDGVVIRPVEASQVGTDHPLVGTIVNTDEEWNALPEHTILVDRDGDGARKFDSLGDDEALKYTPYIVVYVPEAKTA